MNYLELVYARLGQLAPENIHRYHGTAICNPRATRSAIPRSVVDELGLVAFGQDIMYDADGRSTLVEVSEAIMVEVAGRMAEVAPLIIGNQIILDQVVLEILDLEIDWLTKRLVPDRNHPDRVAFRL